MKVRAVLRSPQNEAVGDITVIAEIEFGRRGSRAYFRIMMSLSPGFSMFHAVSIVLLEPSSRWTAC